MLDKVTLRFNAKERVDDARTFFTQGRYHGAAYICGYAIEFALKARIRETLDIDSYPESKPAFKTHKLSDLLLLSGRQKFIIDNSAADWKILEEGWTTEMRYKSSVSFSQTNADEIIKAATSLLLLL